MKAQWQNPIVGPEDATPVVLAELVVRPLERHERARAAQGLAQEHPLGAARPVGRTLPQVVHHHGRWVALLAWGPAALKLTDRDACLGWSASQQAERLELLVQNHRFLALAVTHQPNLASRALALAGQALPEAWQAAHGYRPLLAETFTNHDAYAGTCYQAAGWTPCGLPRGFGRHRADFYHRHGRPKKLWLKALHRNARGLLTTLDVPAAYAKDLHRQSPERSLPIKAAQLDSLEEALRPVPDPRAKNRIFSGPSLLMLVTLGWLAGAIGWLGHSGKGRAIWTRRKAWPRWSR